MNGIWKYEQRLPQVSSEHQMTLGEGQTPLIPSCRLGKKLGFEQLYFKMESLNPTGSYKDRISALGVSLAREQGREGCIGTTSGNAGASIAAYAARAGITYHVYVQENIVPSKLAQIIIHHAQITKVEGFGFRPEVGNQVFAKVLAKAAEHQWELLVTAYAFAPQAMEAVKTIAYELTEDLAGGNEGSSGPDVVFVPVGGGGLFTGIYRGFADLLSDPELSLKRLPRMAACQSAGCANVAKAWQQGLNEPVPGDSTSLISGIQVPNPPDARQVLAGIRSSDGFAELVADDQTWYWQEQLAAEEGIFCEPAGAISLAGAVQALKEGRIRAADKVVCILSGAGHKDVDRMQDMVLKAPKVPLLKVAEI